MPIKPITVTSKGGSDFPILEPGIYLAKCYAMVDEGTHTDVFPNSKFAAKPIRSIRLTWEILQDENGKPVLMENGKPFAVSKSFNMSLDKRGNLRKLIDSWRKNPLTDEEAESFVITNVIGKFCQIQIVHKPKQDGSVRADIGTVMNTSKKADGVNEEYSFSIDDPNQSDFDKLPEWLQNRINDSEEMKGKGLKVTPKEDRAGGISPQEKLEEVKPSTEEEEGF